MFKTQISNINLEKDTNGDGEIDFPEFMEMMRKDDSMLAGMS